MELILCLQDGMIAEIQGDKIIIKIDAEKTKRDLWKSQITFYLENEEKQIARGNLRIENNNKFTLNKGNK